jgi:hypothetical protein
MRLSGKTAEVPGAGLPFSKVPPLLCSSARSVPCAPVDAGSRHSIATQTKLRDSIKTIYRLCPHGPLLQA